LDIEQFYDANPRRRSSREFEYGRDWSDAAQRRCEVSWIVDTGELYLMSAPVEPILSDMFGDETLQRLPTRSVAVEVLAVVPTHAAVDAMLHGWQEAMGEQDSVKWVRERVTNRAVPSEGEQPTDAEVDQPGRH
jgi:hypothetical protein